MKISKKFQKLCNFLLPHVQCTEFEMIKILGILTWKFSKFFTFWVYIWLILYPSSWKILFYVSAIYRFTSKQLRTLICRLNFYPSVQVTGVILRIKREIHTYTLTISQAYTQAHIHIHIHTHSYSYSSSLNFILILLMRINQARIYIHIYNHSQSYILRNHIHMYS